jgi:hypothetical protein
MVLLRRQHNIFSLPTEKVLGLSSFFLAAGVADLGRPRVPFSLASPSGFSDALRPR